MGARVAGCRLPRGLARVTFAELFTEAEELGYEWAMGLKRFRGGSDDLSIAY